MIGIGIDVGGTFVKFFALNEQGKEIKYHKLETDMSKGPAFFIKQIADFINVWKKEFKEEICIGLGLPGDVDNKKGVLRFGTNLKFKNKNIKKIEFGAGIKKLTGIEPVTANDATIAAWGIYELILKKKYANVLVITMGTGIGGGVIVNGNLYQGSHGSAGEIGHIKISLDPKAPLCGCGARGCLEAYAGTIAIHRLVNEEVKKHPSSLLAKMAAKDKKFKIALVSEAAAKGCNSAKRVWEKVGLSIGAGIANAGLILDFDVVVLAGGVSGAAKYFMPALKKRLSLEKIITPFKNLKIYTSQLPEIGGIGAALYAINRNKNAN
ncbi:Repressor, ORF, kinase protein family [Elusimicrobium minutum Pei191]|uniref:Repressor, ORF, kinase protein family n=1 Tax=Elusimicrobium minutum (strain Pei191) TaxID=445932 RepID=B2KBN8_ELUMP|nr:ROK family protein [Elusimicrobium minutum]ACC97725.1 Repressor, ORF, kinase protein family [Elusimicrobium minutum Pei191]